MIDSGDVTWQVSYGHGQTVEFTTPIREVRRYESMAVNATITADDQVPFNIKSIKDRAGNDAQVEAGSETWFAGQGLIIVKSSPPDTPVDGGPKYSATFAMDGPPASVPVRFECDADLGAGVSKLICVGMVTTLAGQATVIEMEAGPVEPRTP